ncbi:MAG: hypothetical protein AMXMBFR7_43720 [Planctomycetota bacterium]
MLLAVTLGVHVVAGEASDHQAEIEWKVAPDGSLQFVAPTWKKTGYKVQPPIPPAVSLADIIWPTEPMERSVKAFQQSKRVFWLEYFDGVQTMLPHFLHGGQDLASLSDPERHFQKLNLGVTDEDLIARAGKEPQPGLAKQMAERHHLDRILAVRLCGIRKLAKSKTVLSSLAAAKDADPHLREAARQSLAHIEGKDSRIAPSGTDDFILAQVPSEFDILIVFRPALAPLWTQSWLGEKRSNEELERFCKKDLKEYADNPNNLWFTQDMMACLDIGTEFSYEIARAFGNARCDRGMIALKVEMMKREVPPDLEMAGGPSAFPQPKLIALALEGAFPKDRWKEHLADLKPAASGGFLVCRKDDALPAFAWSEKQVAVAMNPVLGAGVSKEREVQLADLRKAGIGAPAALLVMLRDHSLLSDEPQFAFLKPARLVTLSLATSAEAMDLEVAFHCGKAEDAQAIVKGFEPLLRQAAEGIRPPPGLDKLKVLGDLAAALGQAKPAVKETNASVLIKIPCTPETLMNAFIEMGIEQRKAMMREAGE